MTCSNPKYIYIRSHYPIDGNKTEENLKRLNKPSMEWHDGWTQVQVPCGHCLGCRLDHANEWATRAACEMKLWKKNCFITFTYNNEQENGKPKNLPISKRGLMTLKRDDRVKFWKRFRKHETGNETWINPYNGKEENPIRFLECGEYGPKGGRPHYHACIFNYWPDDAKFWKFDKRGHKLYKSKKIQKIWGKGFCTIEECNYKTACYVARYVQKKAGIEPIKREKYTVEEVDKKTGEIKLKTKYKKIETPEEQEFINMSRMPGIGRAYFEKKFEEIRRNYGIMIKVGSEVKLKKIPRYFKKLWEKSNWLDYERCKYENNKIAQWIAKETYKKYNWIDLKFDAQKEVRLRQIQSKSLEEKAKLLKRGLFQESPLDTC